MRVNIFSILLAVVIENIVSEIYESSLGENPQGFPARHHEIGLEMLLVDTFCKIKPNMHRLYAKTK